MKYSTETAEEYSKYFKDLKYYNKVSLTADGSYDSKFFKSEGDFFIRTTGKNAGERAYAYTPFSRSAVPSDQYFLRHLADDTIQNGLNDSGSYWKAKWKSVKKIWE